MFDKYYCFKVLYIYIYIGFNHDSVVSQVIHAFLCTKLKNVK